MSAEEQRTLRPAGFGEVFGSAFATWWKTLPITALAALIVLAPAYALAFAIGAAVAPDALGATLFPAEEADVDPENAAVAVSVVLLSGAITWIASVVAFAVCFKAMVAGYAGARPSFGSTLSHGLARGGSAFWVALLFLLVFLGVFFAVAILVSVVAAAGTVLAVLVGIVAALGALVLLVWLGIRWAVALPAVLADDERGVSALRRSARLVSGRWWLTFAVLLVAGLAIGFGSVLTSLILTIPFVAAESDVTRLAASNFASLVTGALTTPLWAAFATVLYFDFRVRKEGISLDDAARVVGAERDPAETPQAPLAPAGAWGAGHPHERYSPPGYAPSAEPPQPPEQRPADQP